MKHWIYLPLQALLYLIALMPFWLLYRVADLIYFFVYYIVRYRVKIVRKNIKNSFPQLSDKERLKIEREFYRNFSDYIAETIKLAHISDEQIKKRMVFNNIELLDELVDKNRSVVAYFSHCFNWEWVTSITLWCRHKIGEQVEFCQVYRPLRNEWSDSYMLKLRSRFNSLSFKKKTVLRDLIMLRRRGVPSITGFMSDQKPSHGDTLHIVEFLNHPSAVITGTEQVVRKLDMAAVYFDMKKPRRGRYEVNIKLMAEDSSATQEMELTDTYIKHLEETIKNNPSIWLWTHNRWKHKVEMPNE